MADRVFTGDTLLLGGGAAPPSESAAAFAARPNPDA